VKRKARGFSANGEGIFDVNMTPLIDVSLVLVVILMVATPMAFQSSIAVRAARESGRAAADPVRTERIEIGVEAGDMVTVNRQQVPLEALGAVLRPLLDESPTRTVVVRCAPGVTHGRFVSVLDEARQQGAAQIAVVGRNP
jgi:biopolymer transport protein ExbD